MHNDSLQEIKKEWHGTLQAYMIGFAASLVLTGLSFGLVAFTDINKHVLTYTIVIIGLGQAVVQLLYFLHLGQEDNPKWETMIFLFMLLLLLVIVIGTLWVMHDLDQRVMPSMESMMQRMKS